MKRIIIGILIMYSITGFAQSTFEKIYNGKSYSSVFVSSEQNEGFILCVSEQEPIWLDHNIKVIKVNNYGDTIWTKRYGTSSTNEHGSYIEPTSDGGYILCGTKVIKIDSIGNSEWERNYSLPTGFIYKVLETNDSGYLYLTRGTQGSYLSKVNNSGDIIWTKSFNYNLYDLQILSDGNYIMTGSIDASSYAENTLILLTDTSGNEIWNKEYNLDYLDRAYSIIEMSNHNLAVCGMMDFADTAPFDAFIMLLDNNGDSIFVNSYGLPGHTGDERAYSICESEDSGFVITGENNEGTFITKVDNIGNEIWTNDLIGLKGTHITSTYDDGYAISGVYNSDKIFLVKTNSLGTLTSLQRQKSNNFEIIAYPNPTKGKVIFDTRTFDSLEILNVTGDIIMSTNKTTIDISGFSNGIYIVKLKYGNEIFIKKIIKH